MKRLYLVRHAKSSWADLKLADAERPLNKRGKHDAPRMGKHLHKTRQVMPNLILCSPAKRAKSTAKRLLKPLNFPLEHVIWHEPIYSGEADEVLALIRGVDSDVAQLMVIGHNPAITELAKALTSEAIESVPTCGVIAIDLEVTQWSDVTTGSLVFFDRPKLL